jgi:hypothetical protein
MFRGNFAREALETAEVLLVNCPSLEGRLVQPPLQMFPKACDEIGDHAILRLDGPAF